MKKYLYIWFALVFLLVSTVIPCQAAGEYPRLTDEADLLTESEEAEILGALDRLSEQQQVDVVICTVLSLEGETAQVFTDNLFEDRFYGMGSNRSCILLMISTEESDWYITTAGYGITALTDVGIEYIGEQIVPLMSQGDFAGAFREYISLCDRFIGMARSGNPFDADDLPKKPFPAVRNCIICLLIGLIASGIVTGKHKAKLITVRKRMEAKDYVKAGSMKVTEAGDMFLYKTVTKSKKEESSGSSSTHKTNSGTTVGGGGGKF